MKTKIFCGICLFLFFSGCSTGVLTPEGGKVSLVNSITATELGLYDEIGPVSCEKQTDVYSDPSESCKNDLRNAAAEKGATFVVMEDNAQERCSWPGDSKICFKIHGRAYRAKAK